MYFLFNVLRIFNIYVRLIFAIAQLPNRTSIMGVCARITSQLLLIMYLLTIYRYIFGHLMLIHIVIICAIFVVLAGCVMKFNASLDATSLGWASGGAVNNSRRIVAREQMK